MNTPQKTPGIYRLETNAALYEALQNLLGGKGGRQRYFRKRVKPDIKNGVLDDVRGTDALRSYFEIDLKSPYKEASHAKSFRNAEFRRGAAHDVLLRLNRKFDAVLSLGFLQHLNDDMVTDLVSRALDCLRAGETACFLEPVRLEARRLTMRVLLKRRGTRLETRITYNPMRVPYDHFWGGLTWS